MRLKVSPKKPKGPVHNRTQLSTGKSPILNIKLHDLDRNFNPLEPN